MEDKDLERHTLKSLASSLARLADSAEDNWSGFKLLDTEEPPNRLNDDVRDEKSCGNTDWKKYDLLTYFCWGKIHR